MIGPFVSNNGRIAKHIVFSQLALLIASYLFLRLGGWLSGVLFVLALLYAGLVGVLLAAAYGRPVLIALGIVLAALSPILVYGKEVAGVLQFGSAYSVDYQQYLAVAHSLANRGLPFTNPYLPSAEGFYHYGFTMPLASLLKLLGMSTTSFFVYSYAFFAYAALMLTELLLLVHLLFFKSMREWIVAVGVAMFASSYKGVYSAAIAMRAGVELPNYDTPIGFKTFQNDAMFGAHYLYSGIFLLHVLAVLSRHRSDELKVSELLLIGVIAFLSPVINAFAPVFLGAVIGAFVLARHWRSPRRALRDPSAWMLGGALALSLFGMRIFDVYSPGLRIARLDFDLSVFGSLPFWLAINFGGLLYLYMRRDRIGDFGWQLSSIALCFVVLCIGVLTIDTNEEGHFSISRRLGTFVLLLLMVNVRIPRLDWRKGAILAPTLATVIGQNYYFFESHRYPSRTVGISRELFDVRSPYRLDEAAYRESDYYRFNFDLVTGGKSVDYPISLGYRQYSPIDASRAQLEPQRNVVSITFRDNAFIPDR